MEEKTLTIIQVVNGNNNTTTVNCTQDERRRECLECSQKQLDQFLRIIESITNKSIK